MKIISLVVFLTLISPVLDPSAYACTRVVYKGPENTVITARSMDWKSEIDVQRKGKRRF